MEHKDLDITHLRNIHLMGIGGAGMSGLALLFHELGYHVSGCDVERSPYTDKLAASNVKVLFGHDIEHLDLFRVELLVYSSAIPRDNPELLEARLRGLPVLQRAELLSLLFNSRIGIGIAGTHGKTTTTSMISLILENAGLDPTVAIGGELSDFGCNAKIGNGPHMVAELDESDGSFENFRPYYSVVTNVDWDHVNYYPTLESVEAGFSRFLDNTKVNGKKVLNANDPGIQSILLNSSPEQKANVVTYGLSEDCDYSAKDIHYILGGGIHYTLIKNSVPLGPLDLSVSGEHNVIDSLASCAVSDMLHIPFESVQKSLHAFRGAKRRLQLKFSCRDGINIYDDYGHHPREIEATLKAIRLMYPKRRIVMIFQPHRYTRTAALFLRFAEVLSTVSQLVILPIYGADERPISGVTSELICEKIRTLSGCECYSAQNKTEALNHVLTVLKPGDLVLTQGAGDVCVLDDLIARELSETGK